MYLKTIDLHGHNKQEAINKISLILFELENNQYFEKIKIITGKGQVLHDVTIEYLENENYQWIYDDENKGAIVVFSHKQND